MCVIINLLVFFKAPEQFLHIPGGPLKTQSWNYTFVDTAVRPLKTVLDYTSTVAQCTPYLKICVGCTVPF
jgi:hypothetical protein